MRVLRSIIGDRDRLALGLTLVLGSAAYFSFTDYQGQRGGVATLDGYYYYVYLRSLQVDGDLDFTNEYREWGNPFHLGQTTTGKARNIFGVGPALLWSPFFVVSQAVGAAGRAVGAAVPTDGLSRFHQVGTLYGSLVYGWLALLFCYLIARQLVGRRHALWAALGAALAGPLPYYCLTGAAYSHAQAAMATSLLTWLWIRWRDQLDRRRWIWLGAATGLAVLVRPATLPFALLPLAEAIRSFTPAIRQRDLPALGRALVGPAIGGLVALLVFSPQLLIWQRLEGTPLTIPQGEGFLWWAESAWHSTLFSPRNGLLPSAPLYLVALLGLFGVLRQRRHPARMLLLVVAGYALLNGAAHDWWGWNFSARRFTSCLPAFALGLGLALRWARDTIERRPARAAAVATASVVAVAAIFNLEWMRGFAQQNLKWYDVRSTQALYMTVTHNLVDRLYRAVGNPLSLPASLPFAIRHGVSPRTYDRLDGSYLLGEINPATNPAGQPLLHAMLDLSSPRFRPNLSESFGGPVRGATVGYVPLRSSRGQILLPINRPGKVELLVRAQAMHAGTKVRVTFNDTALGSRDLPAGRWSTIALTVPATAVTRGVNRLVLEHQVPSVALAPGPRLVGKTGVRSPVDIAVASGGMRGGRFCEIWVDGRLASDNLRGVNVAVISPDTGAVLDQAGFAVYRHKPALYRQLQQFLDRFPAGSIVALGVRAEVGKTRHPQAIAVIGRFGGRVDLEAAPEAGYAAIGILGAPAGTAIEHRADRGHARARVGRRPPPWREVARYSAIRLR